MINVISVSVSLSVGRMLNVISVCVSAIVIYVKCDFCVCFSNCHIC